MLPELVTPIPGVQSQALAERLRRVESRNVTYLSDDFPVFWQRADGINVWDVDGNRFIDFTSAFGVAGLGHTNDEVAGALRGQSADLLHGMGDVHPTELKVALCEQLNQITFGRWDGSCGKTILGNSGFEAVEAALKTALLHTGKPGVISFVGGYHGLGYGTLEVAGQEYFRKPFQSQLGQFSQQVPYPRDTFELELLEKQLTALVDSQPIGCILVEPIQGRGGIIVPPDAFLPLLRTLCDRHGILLVIDEIYTGFNRTGALFACEYSDTIPDIICLGKGLTSGFPLSACVGKVEVMDAWPESCGEAIHTSTFLGNPLGCAMALASVEIHLRSETAAMVSAAAHYLENALQSIDTPQIREVRGRGLILGVELVTSNGAPDGNLAGKIITGALQQGVLLLADGPDSNVVAFCPPFAITPEETDYVLGVMRKILQNPEGGK